MIEFRFELVSRIDFVSSLLKIDYDILWNRIQKYREKRDQESFTAVLIQVDKLLEYLIYKLRRRVFYLRYVEPQDLYQEAVEVLGEMLVGLKGTLK